MASSAELSGKERPQNLLVSGQVDETTRKRDDVCVIVLAAQRSEGGGYDILVNFDSQRRAGAAKALAQLARHRQVILLTCHEEIVETMRVADPGLTEVVL